MLKLLNELADSIATSDLDTGSYAELSGLVEKIIENETRRQEKVKLIHEAMGQLRLNVQYLIFDLESTRRERDALKP